MCELQGEKLVPEQKKLEQRLRIAKVVRMLDGRLMIATLVIEHAEQKENTIETKEAEAKEPDNRK